MINVNPDKKLRLICFDLDGTLADTEPLHVRSKDRLARSMGYNEPIDYPSFVGKPNRVYWEPILAALGRTDVTWQEMERRQLQLIVEIAREEQLPPCEGARELLEEIKVAGIPLALCTSSWRFYAEDMLEHLRLAGVFSFVIGGDQVARTKPSPDLYLAALSHFGVEGSDALAFEDSPSGVAAAKAAGMACVGYKNPTSGDQDLSAAGWQVDSFTEVAM